MIDASTGRARAVLSGRDAILACRGAAGTLGCPSMIKGSRPAARRRVRVLARVASFKAGERRGAMMLWNEGEAPRLFEEGGFLDADLAAFTPDGRLLVTEGLTPGNVVFDVPDPPP